MLVAMRSSPPSAWSAAVTPDQAAADARAGLPATASGPAAHVSAARFPVRNAVIRPAAQVDIVVPVTTEQRDLELSIIRLHSFLAGTFPFTAHVTITAAGPHDGTWALARRLADTYPEVSAMRADAASRGPALRAAWAASESEVLAYLDPDLSIDLAALVPLVSPLVAGDADVAVGTRLTPGARPQAGPRREVTSCGYSLLVQAGLGTGLADTQCGFKAITRASARTLLAGTSDTDWFFDAELIALAERAGLRIREVAVNKPGGRDLAPRAQRHRARWLRGPLARFAAIGLVSTVAYAGIYLALRQVMPAAAANAVGLLITAVANTAANRRFTFGVGGRAHAVRHQLRGLLAFGAGLALTTGALIILSVADRKAGSSTELAVVIAASIAATLLRFGLFSNWVFEGNVA
jgi:putative flippase GtrA